MKSRECIHCKRIFDCNGKVTDKPCLLFEDRRDELQGDTRTRAEEQELTAKSQ